jgi:hypothetical protein
VLEFANLAAFPATGTAGLIYVALDTNKIYRWEAAAAVTYSTWNAADKSASITLSNGNLTFASGASNQALTSPPLPERHCIRRLLWFCRQTAAPPTSVHRPSQARCRPASHRGGRHELHRTLTFGCRQHG